MFWDLGRFQAGPLVQLGRPGSQKSKQSLSQSWFSGRLDVCQRHKVVILLSQSDGQYFDLFKRIMSKEASATRNVPCRLDSISKNLLLFTARSLLGGLPDRFTTQLSDQFVQHPFRVDSLFGKKTFSLKFSILAAVNDQWLRGLHRRNELDFFPHL